MYDECDLFSDVMDVLLKLNLVSPYAPVSQLAKGQQLPPHPAQPPSTSHQGTVVYSQGSKWWSSGLFPTRLENF